MCMNEVEDQRLGLSATGALQWPSPGDGHELVSWHQYAEEREAKHLFQQNNHLLVQGIKWTLPATPRAFVAQEIDHDVSSPQNSKQFELLRLTLSFQLSCLLVCCVVQPAVALSRDRQRGTFSP